MDYWTILGASLPVYLVVATGFFLRRIGLFPQEMDNGVMRLTLNVLYPCFVLDKILGNEALDDIGAVALAAASGFGLVLIGFGIGYLAALAVRMRKSDGLRTFSLATGIQNYGFIPIPIIAKLFDDDATMGMLFMHSLGIELAIWTVGIAILTGLSQAPWRRMINGPLLAIVIGLLANGTGLATQIPPAGTATISMLGSCAIPLSLLLIGAAISDLTASRSWLRPYHRPLAACLVRLAILPVAFIGAGLLLPAGVELKRVLAVQAAMPCALFPIVMARHYGGHVATAVQAVVATSLVSVFTIPAVIGIAMKVLGLD